LVQAAKSGLPEVVLNLPWLPTTLHNFLPNLALTLVISALMAVLVAPVLHLPRWRLALWTVAVSVPLAYTWSATAASPLTDFCATGVTPWLDWNLVTRREVIANLLLFLPAGFAVAVLPQARWLPALLATLAAPVVVELVQAVHKPLNRACEFGDIINNISGAILGFALGSAVLGLQQSMQLLRREAGSDV